MTLNSAPAAPSASQADAELEGVETVPIKAFGPPATASCKSPSKQLQHGNYYPDLLRAACHFCDHLPCDTQVHAIITRFPFNADGRLVVSELAHWNGRENQLADPDPDPWSTIPDGFSDAFAFARVL